MKTRQKRFAKQQRPGAYLFSFAGIAEKRFGRYKKSYIALLLTAAGAAVKTHLCTPILDCEKSTEYNLVSDDQT